MGFYDLNFGENGRSENRLVEKSIPPEESQEGFVYNPNWNMNQKRLNGEKPFKLFSLGHTLISYSIFFLIAGIASSPFAIPAIDAFKTLYNNKKATKPRIERSVTNMDIKTTKELEAFVLEEIDVPADSSKHQK